MPDPVVVVAMREFKAGLLAREDDQMTSDFERKKLNDETIGTADLTAGDVDLVCRWWPISTDGSVVAA